MAETLTALVSSKSIQGRTSKWTRQPQP
jgi:hypothetical protein